MDVQFNPTHIIEVPMTAAEMEAIIGGYHGDAFSVLGPHPINTDLNQWTIRAFLPQAKTARLLLADETIPLHKCNPNGFYSVELPSHPGAYRFEIETWHGEKLTIEDAYRFPPIISEHDLYLHGEGTLYEGWHTWGAHLATIDGVAGVRFAVWAPNAENVSVTGDFNEWDTRRHPMRRRNAGIWEIFIPAAKEGDSYKYFVRSRFLGHQQLK